MPVLYRGRTVPKGYSLHQVAFHSRYCISYNKTNHMH